MRNQHPSLPAEIIIREVVNGSGTDVFVIGGISVVGNSRDFEIVNMRGDVLHRLSVAEAADWVTRNNYRYVPHTRGAYHREVR